MPETDLLWMSVVIFLPTLFALGPDMAKVPTEVNRLDNQVLVHYYEGEWRRWN